MLILKARKNLSLRFTEKQRDILIGCILGDAYITKRGQIQIEHSASQLDYIQWKYKMLQSISYGPPTKIVRIDKRNNKMTIAYRFWTRQFFRSWRERFYANDRKIIPFDLELSPVSMAVWYMDDGHLMEKRRILLSTEGFNPKSREYIRDLLFHYFDITSIVKKDGKILIGTKNTRKLAEHIRAFIVPSMAYKIP